MIENLITNALMYVALLVLAASIFGLTSKRAPEKVRNGLYIPILLAVALIIYIVMKPVPDETPPETVTGEFTVPAYQSRGVPYVNYMSFPIEVDFVAKGEWSATRKSQDRVDPEGVVGGKKTDGRHRLTDSYQGALIARFENGEGYFYIGSAKSLTLQPKEKVLFYMNDFKASKAYSDNFGEVKVHWTCHNCRMK